MKTKKSSFEDGKNSYEDFLTEMPPTAIIKPLVKEDENFFYGELFNPGQVLDPATYGLAMSQVAAKSFEKIPGRTPMVTKMKNLSILEDIKTPKRKPFLIKIPKSKELGLIENAEVLYDGKTVCKADLELKNLPLNILERRFRDVKEFKIPFGKELFLPGFGKSLKIENISDDFSEGYIKMKPHIFKGHFPDNPIIPLAGTSIPAIMLVLMKEKSLWKDKYFGLNSVKSIDVLKPISPHDTLKYRIKDLGDHNYSVLISYFNGEWIPAIKFDNFVIGETKRNEKSWDDEIVADSFEYQKKIPEYKEEHLALFFKEVQNNIKDLIKPKITDIGVGKSANIAKMVQEINPSAELTITDINEYILEHAKKELKSISDVHLMTSNNVSRVIPENLPEQDAILSNFTINYGEVEEELKTLSTKVKPGGVVVLGFINQNPPYNDLANAVVEKLNKSKDWSLYNDFLKMKYVGGLMDKFDILGRKNVCNYLSNDEIKEVLEDNGFEILNIIPNTFRGIGSIFSARKMN